MADIQIPEKNGRRKTAPPKVDLTPMVDLAFILITFFIYATTLNDPKTMVLDKPVDPTPPDVVTAYIDTSTITIIPAKEHKLIYYCGQLITADKLNSTDYHSIRNIITRKQKELQRLPGSYSKQAHELHVIIRPTDESTYEDVINILDEMLINDVPHYALTDITEEELNMIAEM